MDTVKQNGEIISKEQRDLVSQRYKRITKAVNVEFWNSDSEIAHSIYVGSYGRGTAINTSDIDVLVELPKNEYDRFDNMKGNGQSRLLQTLKNAIMATYPKSSIHADGQVVVVDFSDGIRFEVLPAFKQKDWFGNWTGKYSYPDTNMGGNWLTTDPKVEQEAMRERNGATNGLLFDTCKHIRQIRDKYFSSCKLPGIVIDSFVYHYIKNWHWIREGEERSNQPIGTYERRLYDSSYYGTYGLTAPGSGMQVDTSNCVDSLKKVLEYMLKD